MDRSFAPRVLFAIGRSHLTLTNGSVLIKPNQVFLMNGPARSEPLNLKLSIPYLNRPFRYQPNPAQVTAPTEN